MIRLVFAAAICIIFAGSSFAHHAMEYIDMESYSTTKKGEYIFHLHYDYMVDDKNDSDLDHWEFTPGLSYGITDKLMFDFHTHYSGFGLGHVDSTKYTNGVGPFMEACAVNLQYRLNEEAPINVAVSVGYEIPYARARNLIDGKESVSGTLILSKEFGEHSNITANITHGNEWGEEIKSWSLGIKTPLSSDTNGIAGGVEYLADFDGGWSILPGIYAPLAENITFKTGIELGKKGESSRMNMTAMFRF
jgi:opacity protein-like surface antigen